MDEEVICYNNKCSDWQIGDTCWPYSQPSPYEKGSEKKCNGYMPKKVEQ